MTGAQVTRGVPGATQAPVTHRAVKGTHVRGGAVGTVGGASGGVRVTQFRDVAAHAQFVAVDAPARSIPRTHKCNQTHARTPKHRKAYSARYQQLISMSVTTAGTVPDRQL